MESLRNKNPLVLTGKVVHFQSNTPPKITWLDDELVKLYVWAEHPYRVEFGGFCNPVKI